MTTHARNRVITEPDWMVHMPATSDLEANEVMCLFGYYHKGRNSNVRECMRRGSIPQNTSERKSRNGHPKPYWNVKYLRDILAKHNKIITARLERKNVQQKYSRQSKGTYLRGQGAELRGSW